MEPPRLLLVSAEDNRHTLGLQMAEPFFIANGVPTLTVLAGLPLKEVLDLLEFHKPEAVGFSVALAGQMNQVRKAAGRIRNLPDPPLHLLVGGPAVRRGLELDPALGIRACRQLSDVLSLFHGSLAGRVPIKRGNRGGEANPGGLRTSGAVPANVFLVDDDEDVLFLMTRVLRKGGVREVKSFAGGEASLQALRSGDAPDLIILDQNMPGMNGSGTLALIRRLRPDVPVLISSGQSGLEEWPEFNRPWVGVISKPFTMGEIQAKLAQFGG
jgi:CheY-like chemotaxis protein